MKRIYRFFSSIIIFLGTVCFGALAFAQEAQTKKTMDEPPQSLEEMAVQQIDTAKNLINMIVEFLVKYSFQVLGGIIVLVLGWLVARFIGNWLIRFFEKKGIDVTVSKFIVGSVKLTIVVFAVIVALGKFGIEIAPLIAGISVVGFGTSFALQGPLSNYAAGIALIFSKPFKVGEIVEVAGVMGEVLDIKLPKTDLKTVDGTHISIPNKHIVGEIIHNYSLHKRVDVTVGISYSSDVEKAIKIVAEVVGKDERTENAKVGISEFADSSINIYARIWCKQDEYWDVLFDLNKKIFDAFGKNGIQIPFPQRDVHIINKS